MENWASQQKQWQQELLMRDSLPQMEGIARQKNTDDYKDFLMSGRSDDDMTPLIWRTLLPLALRL